MPRAKSFKLSLACLDSVTPRRARARPPIKTPYSEAVVKSQPWAYWQLEEMAGDIAANAAGPGQDAHILGTYARYLEGAPAAGDRKARPLSHALQLVNGGIETKVYCRGRRSYVFAFWNGLPVNARPVTGMLLQRPNAVGNVGIGGSSSTPGKLFVTTANSARISTGQTEIGLKRWYHLALVVAVRDLTLFLDGKTELTGVLPDSRRDTDQLILGGLPSDPETNFQGKVDDIAIYDRALSEKEIATLYQAFQVKK